MGGQQGGMRNELGEFPAVCKKSLQAMAADLQPAIPDEFFAANSVESLRTWGPRELEHAGRLVRPLYLPAGGAHYEPLDWPDALARVATALGACPAEASFYYASGRSSNEAGFLMQLLARRLGTNNVSNCSCYCHQASGVGLSAAIGSGTATIEADDLEGADLFVLIGGNPASNHPRLMSHLMRLTRRGGRVVVVNPVKEPGLVKFRVPSDALSMLGGTSIADEYVQPHIGGDIAFLTGVARAVIARDAVDVPFVDAVTEGYDELRELINATDWNDIEQASGVSHAQIERVADLYARSRRTIFAWTMGITHHLHGVENVQWIANLALLRGMVGRRHAGLLPIRGHSNVQGMGTVGVAPALRDAVLARLEAEGVVAPERTGLDTMSTMHAAAAGEMKFGLALGGNLYGSNPDAEYARRALNGVNTMVYLSTTLNTGHAHGTGRDTVILPVLARNEEPHRTTQESMFNFVRLSDGGAARHDGPRSEVHVLAELARRVDTGDGRPVRWDELSDPESIRAWIARVIPGMEPVATIGESEREFHIAGRVMHSPRFPTPTGRARLHPHPIPKPPPGAGPDALRLMSVRSEGQFNTVVYEEEDLYRGQERRDVVLLNPADIDRLGLRENDRVTVRSDVGAMGGILVRAFDIRAGNALMYFPECNVLIGRAVDPRAGTPAFKSTLIRVEPERTGSE
jgi:molybdopterin-dependent oxidoreductase alpha subunit